MSREWKPGDVARIKGNGVDTTAIRTPQKSWAWVDSNGSNPIGNAVSLCAEEWGGTARPLVVIDPEDREAVERLFRGMQDAPCELLSGESAKIHGACLAQALREFADPKPPKPEEPTGLGAVVEDANGAKHVRTYYSGVQQAWLGYIRDDGGERTRRWDAIDAVTVLSKGHTR